MRVSASVRCVGLLAAIVFVLLLLGLSPGLARASTPGTLDPSFGVGGVAMQSFGADCVADAMAVQPDGRYVVAGTYIDYGTTPYPTLYATLARYNVDGTPDTTFGTDLGMTPFALETGPDVRGDFEISGVRDVALLPNGGGILISVDKNSTDPELLRFSADGILDTSFGVGGLLDVKPPKWTTNVIGWDHHPVVVTPDGKLLLGFTLQTDGNDDLAVMRLAADGTVDTTFGTNGLAYFDIAGASDDRLLSLQVCTFGATAGDVLIGGSVQTTDGVLMRLTPNGSPDATFGKGGRIIVTHGNRDATVADIAQLADGSYLTLNGNPASDDGSLASHYSATGVLDPAFGTGGWLDGIPNPPLFVEAPWGNVDRIAVQPDGSILLAGTIDSGPPTYNDLWVTRYTSTGVIDLGFGVNGQATVDLGGADDCAAAAMGPDGKLVVAGYETASTPAAASALSATPRAVAPASLGVSQPGEGLVRLLCGPSPLLRGPHTYASNKITVKQGHVPAKFLCRANALTRKVTITIKVFKGKRARLVIHLGLRNANQALGYRWGKKITLAKGIYVWKVYAVDQKHRAQSVLGWNKLVVK